MAAAENLQNNEPDKQKRDEIACTKMPDSNVTRGGQLFVHQPVIRKAHSLFLVLSTLILWMQFSTFGR